ncbi:unnamed protein product [Adineta steineri]|uniref:F-box domain-containing protein n=1 Tax=Adineta steineri TaxID=433720 RepID=A0A819EWS7_9BILA|nr:unnamed protein product [Adineta steineri]
MNNNCRFENLPNEIFYQIQSYLNSTDLYKAFFNLNSRFNNSLHSINNLHYEIRSTVENQRLLTALYASRITSISIPDDSDAKSIATIFPNVRSLIFYRAIRLIPEKLSRVERIKLDLSTMRVKHASGLCSLIFSIHFPCLTSFYILHRKSKVVGHWKPLMNSIRHQCLTLTEFIYDIRPTTDWKMVEHFLKYMPNLKRLLIRKLNTRTKWTLSNIANTFQNNLIHLNYLFIQINSLDINNYINEDKNNYLLHPLFIYIKSKQIKSRKQSSITIISSQIL